MISILTLFITLNYALITRFLPHNIYREYKYLIIAPLIPSECIAKELLNYLMTLQHLIFLTSSYFFFQYFIGFKNMIISSLSFILYFIYFSFVLIFIRFLCGHSVKGRNTFYTTCLLINSLVMYQFLLINKGTPNIFAKIFVEYNPLNTLFFICVTNLKSFWFLLVPYIIILLVFITIIRKLSWENHLEFI